MIGPREETVAAYLAEHFPAALQILLDYSPTVPSLSRKVLQCQHRAMLILPTWSNTTLT